MHNALAHWKRSTEIIVQKIDALRSDSSQHSRGVTSLLHQRLWMIEVTYSKAHSAFEYILSSEFFSDTLYNFHESDFSDSDSDSDED